MRTAQIGPDLRLYCPGILLENCCKFYSNYSQADGFLLNPQEFYSWFATTWKGGHVGGQNKRIFPRRIYVKKEFSSQRREMLLFLSTNMAAVTSRANQQYEWLRVWHDYEQIIPFQLVLCFVCMCGFSLCPHCRPYDTPENFFFKTMS